MYYVLHKSKHDFMSRVPRFLQSDSQGQPIFCSDLQGYYLEYLKLTTWNIDSN